MEAHSEVSPDDNTPLASDAISATKATEEVSVSKEELFAQEMAATDQPSADNTSDINASDEAITAANNQNQPNEEVITLEDEQQVTTDSDAKPTEDTPDIEVIGESVRMSTDEDIQMDVTDDKAVTNGPTGDGKAEVKNQAEDHKSSDNDLIIRGLQTSLMLSEEKSRKLEREKKEMEEELKKVYQHLFKAMDDKKTLKIKCETLEEQIEKLVTGGGHKRPAQETTSAHKPTPPKKSQQINCGGTKGQQSRTDGNRRPSFGRFGNRFQGNGVNPPPFPGQNAPEFMPPSGAYAQMPPRNAHGFRNRTLMPDPDVMDTTLTDGCQVVSTVGNRLQLPTAIVDRAVRLFRQCFDSPLRAMCRSRLEPMAVGCLFIACREEHCPQTFRTMCAVAEVDHQTLDQCLMYIMEALDIQFEDFQNEGPQCGPLVAEFCQRSNFSRLIQAAAIQILKKAVSLRVWPPNQNQESAVAAALMLASVAADEHRPVFELSYLTGVSEPLIRQLYNRLLPKARQLFPPNFPYVTPPERLPPM